MRGPKSPPTPAFTLIELLVVITVIAILAGAIGVGLNQGGEGAALASARGIFRTQFYAASSQAALAGRETGLAIVADANKAERYLRHLAVVVQDAGIWRALNEGTDLPGDVVFLPPDEGSSLLAGLQHEVALDLNDQLTNCYLIRFNTDGSLSAAGGGELWMSLGEMTATGFLLRGDAPVVKLSLSRYGALSEITAGETTP